MKQILIIGATSDMGMAFARLAAAQGYALSLAARDRVRLAQLANDLRVRSDQPVETIYFDLLDMEAHASFYAGLEARPDMVICFVGYLGDAATCHRSFQAAREVIDTNYTGVVSIFDQVAEEFEARGNGTLVGVSSVAGDRGRAPRYHYGSAKAGLSAYLSGLRQRLYASGVHVVEVKPGYCRTKMVAGWNLPAAFTSEPDEVARAILKAVKQRRDVIYVRWIWRWIMMGIRWVPMPIFKRMKIGS
jgi:decaprenylphospho-beta-D-erythro-pentofuranosid-2-ulose 2-reductase